jgi:hypothetical protein
VGSILKHIPINLATVATLSPSNSVDNSTDVQKNIALGLATLALSIIASNQAACAATFNLSFSAEVGGFFASPVSGTFSYDAPTINSPITSLNAVNLTIEGYSYSLSEIGFDNSGSFNLIGGTPAGVTALNVGNNDFFLRFNYLDLTPEILAYSALAFGNPLFVTQNFTSFSITPVTATAVPEPLTIIGSLVGGAAALRLRRKLVAANKG